MPRCRGWETSPRLTLAQGRLLALVVCHHLQFHTLNHRMLILGGIEMPEPGTPTLVNPASALLQDLLKEQRAHRSSRGPSSDQWEDAPQTPEGTRTQDDTGSEKARKVNDVFNAGLKKP